jgi:hypothetical protein
VPRVPNNNAAGTEMSLPRQVAYEILSFFSGIGISIFIANKYSAGIVSNSTDSAPT